MLTHTDKKSGDVTSVESERFMTVFGRDPDNIDAVRAAHAGLRKQEQVWLAMLVTHAVLSKVGRTPNYAEYRASLNTFVPDACYEDNTRRTLTAQAIALATKARGDYYTRDGLKLANGEDLKASVKVTRDTLLAKLASLTSQQRDAMRDHVVVPWATSLCGNDADKAGKVTTALADEVLSGMVGNATPTPANNGNGKGKGKKGSKATA